MESYEVVRTERESRGLRGEMLLERLKERGCYEDGLRVKGYIKRKRMREENVSEGRR